MTDDRALMAIGGLLEGARDGSGARPGIQRNEYIRYALEMP